jgi:hypothetical protein
VLLSVIVVFVGDGGVGGVLVIVVVSKNDGRNSRVD